MQKSGEAKMRILLIEDDPVMSKLISIILREEGFVCDAVAVGKEGVEIAKLYDYDLMIVDLMLPDTDGHNVIKNIRTAGIKIPVLILSALQNTHEKIQGLNLGADDYLTKPFNQKELIARIQSIIRRSKGFADSTIELKGLVLDLSRRVLSFNGKPLSLTNKEYSILELMILRRGHTLSKETFLDHLYGGMDEPASKIVDVFMCKLRKKLESVMGQSDCIKTIWGRGYMFNEMGIS